jgi:hypothetical protein
MDLLHPDWWVFRLNWWVAPIEKGGWHRLVDNTLRGGVRMGCRRSIAKKRSPKDLGWPNCRSIMLGGDMNTGDSVPIL